MLAVLRQRGFALLWLAGLVSQLGDWALFIALPFWVYERTGSVPATGVTLALYNVPRLLLSPVAGVLVDRCDRRRTLITADLCSAALLLPLLLASSPVGVPVLPVVYAVVFAQACVVHVVGPASGALVPLVVAAPQLVAANALTTLTGGVARLAGPSLGGALLGLAGFEAVVVVDAASFLVSAALVALVAVRPATAAPAAAVDPPAPLRPAGHAHPTGSPGTGVGPHPMHLWADLGQGLRLIAGVRRLRGVLCANGLVMVGYGAVTVLLAAERARPLGPGEAGRVRALRLEGERLRLELARAHEEFARLRLRGGGGA